MKVKITMSFTSNGELQGVRKYHFVVFLKWNLYRESGRGEREREFREREREREREGDERGTESRGKWEEKVGKDKSDWNGWEGKVRERVRLEW